MDRTYKLLLSAFTASVPVPFAHAGSLQVSGHPDWPNIVLFYLDDMGYGDLSITGAINYTTACFSLNIMRRHLSVLLHGPA